jgi:T-complex protein 1 subunit beta
MIFRQLIYDYPSQLFAEKGVMAIEHADFAGIERLAQVLGEYDERYELLFMRNA